MAERRMFAKSIINSARFLRMPQTSRLLYYDLGMAADDDGIVEAFTVLRTTGAAEDDLRVLVSKGFVRVLNDELVSYITDWSTNNLVRQDRYHPSHYSDLLVQMQNNPEWLTNGLPNGNQRETEVRLGKDSIGKDNNIAGKPQKKVFVPPTVEEVSAFVSEQGYTVDPVAFVSWYESNGWKVGRNTMKNWKAAVVTWERKNTGSSAKTYNYDYEGEGSL